ncbi:MAG TPA: TraB/GumN family protein [Clostridia bacterium]|nr:TraB/GumN family protein [Clostridia bacterium]
MGKKFKVISILLCLTIFIALQAGVYAQDNAQPQQTQQSGQASEQAPQLATQQAAAPAEQPSAWAFDGVNWSAIYGLASQNMFTKYASAVTREELYAVACNLYQRITGKAIIPLEKSPFSDADSQGVKAAAAIGILKGDGKLEPGQPITRDEMADVVYEALKAAKINLEQDNSANGAPDPIKYFVSENLLQGRGVNRLELDKPCTRQELMVFVRRVYEFTVYETGKDSKGLLWKASDEDSSVYLLGSIHLADPSLYPLSKNILNAFDKSDYLVEEIDLTKQAEGVQYMQQKMMYAGDETLDKNVPKDLYDKFAKTVEPLGLKPEVYNKFEPWYAAMLVQSIQAAQSSYVANLGVDIYFTSKAINNKPLKEIEGLKFQVDLFDSLPKEMQVWYFGSSFATNSEGQPQGPDVINALLSAWKSGDSATVEKFVAGDESKMTAVEKEFNQIFWTSRNNNMYEKTKGYLADPEKKTYFIVVGAGHMEGKTGIVTQLKANGFKVEQIK